MNASASASHSTGKMQALTVLVALMMVISAVLAVFRPPWLLEPLQAVVQGAGVFAPLMFMALVSITTPLHASEVLVMMSILIWPLPSALGLSIIGAVAGSALSSVLISRLGGATLEQRNGWPPFLQQLATRVAQRPVLIGIFARVAFGTGLAIEAFFKTTGLSKAQYLIVSGVGITLWVAQKLIAVVVARAAFQFSPWLLVGLLTAAVISILIVQRFRRARTP